MICSLFCFETELGIMDSLYIWHSKVKVKVKQSLYRPEPALRFLGGWGSQISRLLAREGGNVFIPICRPPLLPAIIPGTHFF
jgi:hypothetical protein